MDSVVSMRKFQIYARDHNVNVADNESYGCLLDRGD